MLQCLTRDKALSVVKDGGKADLSEDDYQQLSTLLLYYVVNLEDLCASHTTVPSSSSSENDQFYVLALTSLHPDEDTKFLSSSEIGSILQLINQHYHPSNQETSQEVSEGSVSVLKWARMRMRVSCLIQQCVEATSLLQDLNIGEDLGVGASSVPKLAAAIITHILQGHCIRHRELPSPAFFTDYIFQSLNRTSNLQILGNCWKLLAMLVMK